jgi:hypothetical protein
MWLLYDKTPNLGLCDLCESTVGVQDDIQHVYLHWSSTADTRNMKACITVLCNLIFVEPKYAHYV